ncbi:MAG: hypothetical protein HRT89_02040 [Lentisphaeria bacterium]|nr:hypothetical protein [Lentisphaeria bacterium]NQZ66828.1 hypothetical protein [Lentisphaeria bacterium]
MDEKLIEYLHGELPEDERSELETQLSEDAELKALHDELKQDLEQLSEIFTVDGEAPRELSADRLEAIFAEAEADTPAEADNSEAGEPIQMPRTMWWSVAACFVIVALIGVLNHNKMKPAMEMTKISSDMAAEKSSLTKKAKSIQVNSRRDSREITEKKSQEGLGTEKEATAPNSPVIAPEEVMEEADLVDNLLADEDAEMEEEPVAEKGAGAGKGAKADTKNESGENRKKRKMVQQHEKLADMKKANRAIAKTEKSKLPAPSAGKLKDKMKADPVAKKPAKMPAPKTVRRELKKDAETKALKKQIERPVAGLIMDSVDEAKAKTAKKKMKSKFFGKAARLSFDKSKEKELLAGIALLKKNQLAAPGFILSEKATLSGNLAAFHFYRESEKRQTKTEANKMLDSVKKSEDEAKDLAILKRASAGQKAKALPAGIYLMPEALYLQYKKIANLQIIDWDKKYKIYLIKISPVADANAAKTEPKAEAEADEE